MFLSLSLLLHIYLVNLNNDVIKEKMKNIKYIE